MRRSLIDSSRKVGDPELSSELGDTEFEEADPSVVSDVLEKVEEMIFDETLETFSEVLVMEECAVDYALEEVAESIICDTVDTSLKDLLDHCAGCKTLKVQLRSAQKRISWLSKRKRELEEKIGKVSTKKSLYK